MNNRNFLHKNQCLCWKCGGVYSNRFSRLSKPGSAARYLAKPSLPIQFAVSAFGKRIRAVDISAPEEYTEVDIHLEDPKFQDGFLESFKATIRYTLDGQQWTTGALEVSSEMRVCPRCAGVQYLMPHAGQFDAYLIGELGRPGVGKTQFAKAVASPRFKLKRDSFLGEEDSFSLLTSENVHIETVAADPTHLDQTEIRTFLVKRKGLEPILLYLMDIAGEFLSSDKSREQERAVLKRILTNHCSAFFAFYDPREIPSTQFDGYRAERGQRESDQKWEDPMPLVNELFSSEMPPVAYILTGLDTLMEVSQQDPDGWIRVDGEKAFSAKSALNGTDSRAPITAKSLRERMLLSRAAMCRLGLLPEGTGRSANNGWFVVSSGKVDLPTRKADLDFARGVIEPLAWFLSMAGIAGVREA